MEPKNHNSNVMLGAPPGWDKEKDGECLALPVNRQPGQFTSYWQPSPEDIARICAGGHVRLTIYSDVHPPVWLDTERE